MKNKDIIEKMTLEDKIALCSGENFWESKEMKEYNIPSFFMCDGPHGLRKQDLKEATDMLGINDSIPSTCFPTAVTTACSWDTKLIKDIGDAISKEALENKVGLVLGPGVNIKRDPLCGRNFEYFSEDPYLAGKLSSKFIIGLEQNGIASSIKHFAFNNQEYSRFNSDSVMDERTMREIYLTPFEIAIKEGKPSTVMCAYNKINGVHCSDSKMLLTDILREEWGFDGLVVTDWGAMNDRIEGFRAGCDLSMPGGSSYLEKEVAEAIDNGHLSEDYVDASADRVIELGDRAKKNLKDDFVFDRDIHHSIAVGAAEKSAVLLKNDNILPLKKEQKVAVIGHMAKYPRYQGSGSSHVNPTRISIPLEAMPNSIYASGCDEKGDTTKDLLLKAKETAQKADIAVVFVGLPDRYESEGFDRDNINMPEGHLKIIEAVAKANENTIVVLFSGSVVDCSWEDKVKSILYMGLPGQGVGKAVANLLYGHSNPSGKLAESWPLTYSDCPTSKHYLNRKNAQYREGIYVGYRYYDKANIKVRWPFGYGLSYTSFEYSDLKIKDNIVSLTVKNVGKMSGSEVVQLYISPPKGGLHRTLKELKGFNKVYIEPGESKNIEFALNERSFAIWDNGWTVEKGTYTIMVGPSSVDLPLKTTTHIEGGEINVPTWQKDSWYENVNGKPTKEEWESMLGRKYEEEAIPKKGSFTMDNSCIEMMDQSLIMKLMFKATETFISKGFGWKKDYSNPEFRMMIASSAGSPLRNLQISSGIKGQLFNGLLDMANGHFFRGIVKIIKN